MENKLHTLGEYRAMLEERGLLKEDNLTPEDREIVVSGISFDSREVKDDTLFICKGAHFKEEFLKAAFEEGACCYVAEERHADTAACIIVGDVRKAMAYIAAMYYNNIFERLNLIGITGTKGKSTTAYFMRYILDDFMKVCKKPKSAVISSIDTYDGVEDFESHITTPEAFDLYKHFYNAVSSEIEYLTMEVSSQALKYDRTLGVNFDIGCYLNIGIDHISDIEHSDFEDYFSSKLRLFKQCETAVINLDDKYADRVLESAEGSAKKILTFGTKRDADIYGYDIRVTSKGISFRASCDSFDEEFKISLHGLFNVQNALAAIAISYALNIPLRFVKSGLEKAKVSGRMEVFRAVNTELCVIVDYAHNKMSFESLFESTKQEYPGRKISIVFGCPGKKAQGRRRELGEIAGKYADMSYITEEDAGEESVMKISEEIAGNIRESGGKCVIIPDRREAIGTAIENAEFDEIILITGKGRETRQKRGMNYVDTPSDVDYVEEFLYGKE